MNPSSTIPLREQPIVSFPTLANWTTTLESKFDAVLSAYICTNYQQSTFFLGRIKSLTYTLGRYAQDPENFTMTVQSELKYLLSRYFKQADVIATARSIPGKEHFIEVILNITISDLDGSSYTQKSKIVAENSKLRNIIHYTNTGEIKYERDLSQPIIYR